LQPSLAGFAVPDGARIPVARLAWILARSFSIAFGPPVMPFFLAFLLPVEESLSQLATHRAMYIVTLSVLPCLLIYALFRSGRVSDLGLAERRERMYIALPTAVCALLGAILLAVSGAPAAFVLLAAGGCLQLTLLGIVTYRTKVSYHVAGVGSMACSAWLFIHPVPAIGFGLATVVTSWSRWYLRKHTVGQIAGGLASCGVLIAWVMLAGPFFETRR
jgi:hypothetical protein